MFNTAETNPRVHPQLVLVACGRYGVHSMPLSGGRDVVLGRSEDCEFRLSDPTLSRVHARFRNLGQSVVVEDLKSRHGTWLNDRRVERANLTVGSAVRLADVAVTVAFAESVLPERTSPVVAPHTGVYASPQMLSVMKVIRRAALTELPVIVLGETGTGKELAAREVHLASPRRDRPLRVLNCAAISPHLIESTLFGHERGAFTGAVQARAGVFEEANGGTVFLDEVGELSPSAQAALLRVLETRRLARVGSSREIDVDVRIVSATNRDLHAMAARGEFRTDTLHRLSVISVELPPLRARREEISLLAAHFLNGGQGAKEIAPSAMSLLEGYDWPGNIRELRNALARAAALAAGPCITVEDLPGAIRQELPRARAHEAPASTGIYRKHLRQVEMAEFKRVLGEVGGNQRKAAALLGMPLRTFERRLHQLRVDVSGFIPGA